MNAHFQRTFWPITATAAFFGLALIEYPLGKPRRVLSLIYTTVAISIQIGMFIIFLIWSEMKKPTFAKFAFDILMFCGNFITLVSVYFTHWHGKKYHKCIEQFNDVDETLKALGIETDYSKLRRVGIVSLIIWAFMCIILNAWTITRYRIVFADNSISILVFFTLMPLHVRMLTQMQFWSVLGYACTKFDCINAALRKLTIDDNNCGCWFRTSGMISVRGAFVPDERTRRIIWTVMHLHFHLGKILRDINTVFETQMCLQMGFDCVVLVCSTLFVFRLILLPFAYSKFSRVLLISAWILPCLADVIVINHLCETVGAKARTVSDMAAQLLLSMDDEKLCEDVSLIVLQTKLRPLKFSCLGLYYFGYDFMYQIFSTTVATAVLMLQLKAGLEF